MSQFKTNLSQLVRRQMQLNAAGVATVQGDRRRTWRELGDRVARLAGALRGLGAGAGDRVAMLALNSDRYYEFYFGSAWAGTVFVPINTRLAPAEIVYWLNDSECSVLLIDDTFLEPWRQIASQVPSVKEVVYVGDGDVPEGLHGYESLIAAAEVATPSDRGGDDLAGLFYTGGTTGRSKGVMLSHRGLSLNPLQAQPYFGFLPQDRFLHAAPMFHLADGFFCMASATVGATSVFVPAFEPQLVLETLESQEITQALLVPTMINMTVHHAGVESYDLSSLRGIMYGASPMPEAVIKRAMEVLPNARFFQAYGQTETSPILTILGPEHHLTSGPFAGRLESCGQAVSGVDIQIQDEVGREVPVGEVGEICACEGDNIMLGYWNMPNVTAETLRGGWLHTGDGGRMDEDGFVYIVDRVKDMIISGGENVYSAEVENAVYQHPAVAECAVIGIPHEKWGEQVHAIVRLKDGAEASEAELISHCKERIANYKCPRSVDFRSEPLPLSGAGKILKKDLRAPFWEGQDRAVH